MYVQKKLATFIYWVRDLQKIQEMIIYTLWTQSQLVLSMQELEVEASCAKADPVDIKVGNIDVGRGWDDWKERFVKKIGSTTGVDGLSRKYIIHDINTQGWVAARDTKTDTDRIIYLVSLHGPGYNMETRGVWNEIQNCCIGTISYERISEFEANEDGRAAWLALLQKYKGKYSKNKRILLDNQAISLHPQQGLFYKNEHTFLFEKILQACKQIFRQPRSIKTKSHRRKWCRNWLIWLKFRITRPSLWPRPKSRTTSLGIDLALCPILKIRSLEHL